jgi:hypothetical protein
MVEAFGKTVNFKRVTRVDEDWPAHGRLPITSTYLDLKYSEGRQLLVWYRRQVIFR